MAAFDLKEVTSGMTPQEIGDAIRNGRTPKSRTEMKAITGLTAGDVVYLSEGGRSGTFEYLVGDYSAEVAADTLEGVYVELDGVAASVGVLRRSDWDGKTAKSGWFDKSQNAIDYLSSIFTNTAKNSTSQRGKFIMSAPEELAESIILKSNIDHDFARQTITISGSFIATDDAVITSVDDNFFNGSFSRLNIICANDDIYGFNVDAINSSLGGHRTIGCLRGNKIRGGYGVFGTDIHQYGTDGTSFTSDAYGFSNSATDSVYDKIYSVYYPQGFLASGNNTRWYGSHAWSLPTRVRMKTGWDITNEGNELFGCISDTPTPIDTGVAPSVANGGYGFLNRDNAAGTKFYGCEVIASEQAGNVDNTVIPYKMNKEGELYGCKYRNYATTTDIFITPAVQFISNTVKQESTIIGGNILSSTSGNIIFPGLSPNQTSSVGILIGGAAGVSYNAGTKYCNYSTLGMTTSFSCKFVLSALNGLTGAVTVSGLPFSPVSGYGLALDYIFPAHIEVSSGGNIYLEDVLVRLVAGSSNAELIFGSTGAAVSHSDISGTSQIIFNGSVLTNEGFFDDID